MQATEGVSRRRFVGGMAAILGTLSLPAGQALAAGGPAVLPGGLPAPGSDYDSLVKLCYNENSYGPPKSVLDAITGALKFANRYGAPDGGITSAIASLHGVSTDHIVLGAGSSEILDIVGTTFLTGGKRVIGVEPTFSAVYEHATGLNADAIRLPLRADFRQDIPAIIKAAKDNHPNVGFVYLCNPNNPTGMIVTKDEVQQLLDGLPSGVPVLIDEAYHHFVEDPAYATSIPHVVANRPVIVARTFSKIAALAGLRLGYAVTTPALIQKMAPYIDTMDVNVLAKWGGAAMLADTASMATTKANIIETRKKNTAALTVLGYTVLPSEANFFMVNLRRDVRPVIQSFRREGILVGRPFPPMNEHLRVSVGTPAEMDKFMAAFHRIMAS